MKPALLTLLFGLTLCGAGGGDDVRATAAIRSTMDNWKKAMLARDASTLEKLYHKDLLYEHSSGKTETKAEAIAAVVKAEAPYVSMEFDNPSIRVFGTTALVKSILNVQTTASKLHLDTLFVLLKTGDGWQIVGREATKLQ